MTAGRRSAIGLGLLLVALSACDATGTVGIAEAGSSASDGSAGNVNGDGSTQSDDAGDPGSEGGMEQPPIEGLRALRIDPESVELTEDGVAPFETASFKATGTFDGGDRDVTAEVNWTLDNEALGEIEAGEFSCGGLGGIAIVRATSGDLTATAMLRVRVVTRIYADGTDESTDDLFPEDTAGDQNAVERLRVIYPSDETMFPRNLERVTHQWTADGSLDTFEMRFESDVMDLRVYTRTRDWLPNAAQWSLIAGTHPNQSLRMSVRAVASAAPATVYGSQSVRLLYSATEVLGALYYWSTGAEGVMKANLASPVASKFFPSPDAEDADTCVSCHTVSRDGRKLAVNYGGEKLRQVSIPDRGLEIPAAFDDDGPAYGWGTFNPGATRLLYAHKGELTLLDADTGALLRNVEFEDDDIWATHPDWSPDGRHIVVAYKEEGKAPGNKDIKGSGLARIPVNPDGSFGALQVLLESTSNEDTLYFPSYSPDSRWIAFVRGDGKSKDNESAELFLVAAEGGAVIEMPRLNRRVRDVDGVTGIGNSMPTWAPTTDTGQVFWLALSSLRDYGNVLVGEGRDQLWGAAIDPTRIGGATDPSYASFWMPFQQLDEGNHRAFWAIDSEQQCPTDVEICDGLDNDCDAIVDEDCCTPTPEVCGDGIDNDCDGTVDDGCGCQDTEICDNGEDDDCDELIDLADEDCIII